LEGIVLETDDHAAALAALAVVEMERIFPARPVGRSLLQKLFYIFTKEGGIDVPFELFMCGPYSDWVEGALIRALESGMLTIVMENGRSCISARGGISGQVLSVVREEMCRCVRSYGFYDEGDLAILTTSLFLEDQMHLGPVELAKAVCAVNPRFDMRRVCSLVDRSDVVYRSW
jgi:hypothetical protein